MGLKSLKRSVAACMRSKKERKGAQNEIIRKNYVEEWNASSGTFDLGRMNMSWTKPISRAWDKRQKKIEAKVEAHRLENQEITYTFDEFGSLTGVYVDGTLDTKMTIAVQEAIATNSWNTLKAFGVGIADKIYENFGLSALMGERTLDTDSVGTKPYEFAQFVGDLLSVAGGAAEFVGGFTWLVGGNAASFAGTPFTGGASATFSPAVTASGLAAMTHGVGTIWNAFSSFGEGYGSGNYPNGKYEPSPKHDPKSGWGSPNTIPNKEVGQKLLDTAYTSKDKKQLFNFWDGKLVKFQPDTTGSWHAYDVVKNIQRDVPADVLRAMQKDGVITSAQYRKLIKQ